MSQSANKESAGRILAGIVAAIVIGTGLQLVALQADTQPVIQVASVAAVPTESAEPVVVEVDDSSLSDRAQRVADVLEGTWRNVEDPTIIFEFSSGGILKEHREEGDVTRDGIWGTFTSDMVPEGETALPEGVTYLQTTLDDVTTTSQVGSVSGILQLVDITNGQVTHFQKI